MSEFPRPPQVILAKVQENSSNKVCADCADANPVWGVVNLGIMVCINCSGEEGGHHCLAAGRGGGGCT